MSEGDLTAGPVQEARNPDGTFAKGKSGNPAGRARMSPEDREALRALTPKAIAALGKALDDLEPRIYMAAAVAVLNRVYGTPAPASESASLPMPTVTNAAAVTQASAAVLEAASKGEIALDDAKALQSLLEGHRKAIETQDLEARIAALEAQRGNLA